MESALDPPPSAKRWPAAEELLAEDESPE